MCVIAALGLPRSRAAGEQTEQNGYGACNSRCAGEYSFDGHLTSSTSTIDEIP
jgi:hypothetical protein